MRVAVGLLLGVASGAELPVGSASSSAVMPSATGAVIPVADVPDEPLRVVVIYRGQPIRRWSEVTPAVREDLLRHGIVLMPHHFARNRAP
jgi:hypothetical protein